jgi:vitamin K-dependent gamma-carboxylase-like protein
VRSLLSLRGSTPGAGSEPPLLAALSRVVRALSLPRSPLPLALLRIAVSLIILVSPEPQRAQALALGPPELWLPPPGMDWFLPLFAWLAPYLWLAQRVLWASALLALLGLWTRLSLSVLALSFVLLFGGAQLGGRVVHDMHLLWLLLLLMVSPSAQVLSLDAWAKGSPLLRAPPSSAAALATSFARLLLGLVYFFPGLHKLLDGGVHWASSRGLQNQLWLKWFQAGGDVPWPRVDLSPRWLAAGGVAVLIFELSFVSCVCWRWGRIAAGGMGLSFHALTQHFMYIRFPSLWACYVVLWDGPGAGLAEAAPTVDRRAEHRRQPWTRFLLVPLALALVLGVIVQGARGETQAWPFACYPSFSEAAPDTISDLAVELRASDGELHVLRIGPLPPSSGQKRSPQAWSTVWRLAGLYGDAISPPRLLAFASELMRRGGLAEQLAQTHTLRFYVEAYAIAPETYGMPPLRRVLIHESVSQARSD